MTKKLLVVFALFGLSLASAKSYSLTLNRVSDIGGKELKAGDYKLELKDQTVVISSGKVSNAVPVTIENEHAKFDATAVRYDSASGQNRVREIRLGGTTMKLVFNN